ncbi:hypothetical protein CSE16_16910 [Solibacillus sp. R5-41]|uniref:DUF72 domain-containing protein n=1 Tax=Solibacillus sp. R5-41 TaxID=2048654 RepID=UPI000C127767|nr:DUF72 domain-containing protein [Solibacillus sp. R5-41]ATP41577.1 hypothetical protein CSE16_16910 [Solibacillus sp. R5-41]
MIYIGLTGWGDHPDVYSEVTSARDKLFDYSGHFPIVEVDTSFYAIPSKATVEKWCKDTPENFRFVVKAYQGMTGHLRDELPYETRNDMFNAFIECAQVFQKHGKLAMILVQFPPWFDCQGKNVQYIRYVKKQLASFPVAIEFRNQSWYSEKMKERTLQFLKESELIHTVCDEPQAGSGSVPFVPIATHDKVLVRIHGRNVHGWRNIGHGENWRKVRFLYDYNQEELKKLSEHFLFLEHQAKEVYILFNNNSGGHAAKNAKMIQQMLQIQFDGLAPKQMNMFEE